jgi:predicted chitinase
MAKNFLKEGILKARAMYAEDVRGFNEGGYVTNAQTKVATGADLGSIRLQNKRSGINIQTLDDSMLREQMNENNGSLVRRRQQTSEDSRSILDKAYGEIRNQNQLLRDEMEAMSDQGFYSETGDELGQVKPPVSRKSEFPTFDKVVPTFSAKQNELQSYIFEKAKDRGYEGPELAQFMAQVAIETDYFKTLEEYGGGKDKYGGGKRYKGRGFLQLTHDYNYKAAGKALGYAGLADNPDLVLDRETAAETSFWFWETNVRPKVKDFSNTSKVTRIVNGPGMLKTPERNDAYNFMKLSGTTLYEE